MTEGEKHTNKEQMWTWNDGLQNKPCLPALSQKDPFCKQDQALMGWLLLYRQTLLHIPWCRWSFDRHVEGFFFFVFLPIPVRLTTCSFLENPSFIKVLCLTEGWIFEEKQGILVMKYLGYQQEFAIGIWKMPGNICAMRESWLLPTRTLPDLFTAFLHLNLIGKRQIPHSSTLDNIENVAVK